MVKMLVREGPREVLHIGVVEDVSRSGLCVGGDLPIPAGASVVVSCGRHRIETVVRHCSSDGLDGWRIGLEFVDGYEWNRTDAWPEHLLRACPEPVLD
jgi:hypothetical protein